MQGCRDWSRMPQHLPGVCCHTGDGAPSALLAASLIGLIFELSLCSRSPRVWDEARRVQPSLHGREVTEGPHIRPCHSRAMRRQG